MSDQTQSQNRSAKPTVPTSMGAAGKRKSSKLAKISHSSIISLAQNADGLPSAALDLVKSEASNFVENSKFLISALNEVAKIHPFVQGTTVSIFTIVLTLELNRQENDLKVVALNGSMCEMMSTLTILKQIPETEAEASSEEQSIGNRLRQRMDSINDAIQECGKLCDSYRKRNIAIRFLSSGKWQIKFSEITQKFAELQLGIQLDLQLYTSVGIVSANQNLATVKMNIDKLTAMIFEHLRTSEERELAAFIAGVPGGKQEVVKKKDLLDTALRKVAGRDGKRRALPDEKRQWTAKDIEEDIDQILMGNRDFDLKFEAMKAQLEEVRDTVKHESDRVIDAVLSGPHDRIIDKDIHQVWKDMGWKRSVKARHLVLALHDHFQEKSITALQTISKIANENNPDTSSDKVKEIVQVADRASHAASTEDWALEFMSVYRVQFLIEAMDKDVSSFITIAEVNDFTAERPQNWSLPHWIAYWTIGFELTQQWYFRRIRKVFVEIQRAASSILPTNRLIVSEYVNDWPFDFATDLLVGLHNVNSFDDVDWEYDTLFSRFKDYVVEDENRIDNILCTLNYTVDDEGTLLIIAGAARLEKFLLPVLYLILRRSLEIIQQASSMILHEQAFTSTSVSLAVLQNATWRRIESLEDLMSLQTTNAKETLQKYFYGMYSCVRDWAVVNDTWLRDEAKDDIFVDEFASSTVPSDTVPANHLGNIVFREPQVEELDQAVAILQADEDGSVASPIEGPKASLVDNWYGSYTYNDIDQLDGLVSFHVSECSGQAGDVLLGSGADMYGGFSVHGKVGKDESRISFVKEYEILQYGDKVAWLYEGNLNKDRDEITGTWGPHEPVIEEPATLGTFFLRRRSVDYILCSPPDADFEENRYRALWKLATIYAIRVANSHLLRWNTIHKNRQMRQHWIDMMQRHEFGDPLSAAEEAERADILRQVHPETLKLWRAISVFKRRREISHRSIECSNCHKQLTHTTRLICIKCWKDEVDWTIDLCPPCIVKSFTRTMDNKTHLSDHSLVQLRTICLRSYIPPLLKAAQSILESTETKLTSAEIVDSGAACQTSSPGLIIDGAPAMCMICEEHLDRPFWCCLTCPDHGFLCWDCNFRVESEQPWLLERTPYPETYHDSEDKIHSWAHTLVLIPRLPTVTAENFLSVERQLVALTAKLDEQAQRGEARFEQFASEMSDRMERLEKLLSRIVQ
ncbi:hypothetical protein BDP27DRAFT_153111 [Rhodocollybia butyracea]|uniref:Uncharacterized protein n=1 Tax=Rhodocollybia butyracea TaxID=206335 RepID=A0A9P5PFB7_9AGAR|nr:hypothetical protein BDP27DRAFT_153111 [Rhodocollybia butyracea]